MNELVINNHVRSIVNQFLNLLSQQCKKDRKKYFESKTYYICAMMNQFTSKYENELVNKKLMNQEDYKKIYSKVSDIFFLEDIEVLKELFDDNFEKTRNAVKFLGLVCWK